MMKMSRLLVVALFLAASQARPGLAAEPEAPPCSEDAMIVFDASGSMAGTVGLGIATPVARIDVVRSALGKVLPSATKIRRVGLISYGPGPYQQCNVHLDLAPMPNSAERIMKVGTP